ncbi:hypothetical protein LZ32DRAFT_442461 [Colletotrichum eremochloae]|nr:hypothetical protein LZ32DRAFT_442461 [Colletotrichum eremochloae]
MTGFHKATRHQSSHTPGTVGDDISAPRRRQQHDQYERTGPRHCSHISPEPQPLFNPFHLGRRVAF